MLYKKITVKENNNRLEETTKNSVLNRLLALKGILEKDKVKKFLNPSKKDFISPYAFKDMKKAKERIFKAIEQNEKILVWGDFDCDGTTSSAILFKALKELKADVLSFIPDRLLHGHGLNSGELLKFVSKHKVKLIITVDCGISNVSEVALLKNFKTDVIITDHHSTDSEIPNAYAIINPQVKNAVDENLSVDDITSLSYNSGSIVAYKLAMALLEDNENQDLKDELLTIASCGAIADVVPLLGENRSIVNFGLQNLNQKKENSSKAIYKLLSQNVKDRDITSYDVAFILAPRINAVGRLSNAKLSFDFLLEKSDELIELDIQKLDNYNTIRQSKCSEVYDEIIETLKQNPSETKNPAIILINKDWHIGVIGIVAAKIVERFEKPCFLMTIDENNNARCSIRSNDLINVYQVLKENETLFSGFGGHKLAGGCSFDLNKISFEEVKTKLLETIKENSNENPHSDQVLCDIELDSDDINLNLIETINELEPFGQDNEAPLCAMFNVTLEEFKRIGKEQNHLRLIFSKDDKRFQAVKWSENEIAIPLKTKCDIAFRPHLNTFMDNQIVQLEIFDVYQEGLRENQLFKSELKIYDHRKKTGILEQISSYLASKNEIGIWAKTSKTKEALSKFENIKNNFIEKNQEYSTVMFFDYPTNIEEFREILSDLKPKKIHLMNLKIDENLENYIKIFSGMIKFCANKLDGKLEIKRFSRALGTSEEFIQLSLEILENINSIEIIDIDKIKYLKSFTFETFRENSMFEILKEEFEKNINFKKSVLNSDLKEVENLIRECLS